MFNFKKLVALVMSVVTIVFSSLALAQDAVTIDVQGNKVEAVIHLPGNISADITLAFENAVGLTRESIGISAEIIDVTSLSVLERLPDTLNVSTVAAFPMMITIEPLTDSGFSFSGLATLDIHTHNLEYTAGTPLRFFKAPLNGSFKDITMTMGAGSYRARGSIGRFSQFIIAADIRAPLVVANQKYQHLLSALTNFSSQINAADYAELLQDVNAIEQLMTTQQYALASNKVNEFNRHINAARGTNIPDVWRSSRDIDNVAGELMAYANTLRFSLRLIP
ncbi:DUF6689 family protein [Thalassotalea sp. SU-HH00458]|uniref:DUF6689 family protein n=1 Tax=Thalassotalea sp. SU-HH00458 TaxID=3127657 RepID=UPI00310798AB